MNPKTNQYGDFQTDKLNHSGVKSWSAGDTFPYIVYKQETHCKGELISAAWIVSFAGEPLAEIDAGICQASSAKAHREAEALALEFKREGIKDRFAANWHDAREYEAEAKRFVDLMITRAIVADMEAAEQSQQRGRWRDRADNLAMYGTPEHNDLTLSQLNADRLPDDIQ